jgi:TolB protein
MLGDFMDVLKVQRKPEDRKVRSILEILDTTTNICTQLCEMDFCIEAPNWTRDGKRLVYNSGGYLYSYELDTGRQEKIDTGFITRCNNDHVLSPNGKSVAVSHHTVEDGQSRIYTLPLDGGKPVLVTPIAPSYLHGWSPDGKMLAYCAERNGQYDVYVIPSEGGEEVQLTNEPGLDDGPEFSPDGKHIWFNSVRSGLMQIYRMDADGGNIQQMTNEKSNNWFPHVSSDGKLIVYIAYREGDVAPGDHPANKNVQLRLMPYTGGESRLLMELLGGQGTINVNSWAPDSRRLAFVRYKIKE